jgi:hypothetical protein
LYLIRISTLIVSSLSEFQLLKKIKFIISSFRRSTKLTALLKEIQLEDDIIPLRTIADVKTRWSSSYMLLKKYMVLHDYIQKILNNNKIDTDFFNLLIEEGFTIEKDDWYEITNEDIVILSQVVCVLQLFYNASKILEGNNYVTISRVSNFIWGIQRRFL